MLQRYDNFFSPDECEVLLSEVKEFRTSWNINPVTQFRTLGNSLFSAMIRLGLSNSNNYATETTLNLKVYEMFKERLMTIFPKVEFTSSLGKPGYTIILPNQDNSYLWHYDNELPLFPYQNEFPDYNKDFHSYFEKSYTFVLMLSNGDYKFDYFPETVSEYKNTPKEEIENYYCKDHVKLIGDKCTNPDCTLNKYETIEYKQGTLLIQEQRFLHRASPAQFSSSDDMRVIVRGYGVVKDNVLYIFW